MCKLQENLLSAPVFCVELTRPCMIFFFWQDGFPIKRDRVHLINCPGLIDKGLRLMRHMGRQEDWDRVSLNLWTSTPLYRWSATFPASSTLRDQGSLQMRVYKGDDFSELHEYVPPQCLPRDLGGDLPPLEELHGKFVTFWRKLLDPGAQRSSWKRIGT